MSNTIFNLSNVQNALVDSPLEGRKILPLDTIVAIKASEWQQCLERIQSLCSTKWIKKRKLCGKDYIFGETRKCHRAGRYTPKRQIRLAQKDSKLCKCEAILQIKQHINNPEVVMLCMTKDHTNHIPGDNSDIRTLPLTSEVIRIIKGQLKEGKSCRNVRISVLEQIEEWGVDIRKPSYEDIYNIMRKMKDVLYRFHSDENNTTTEIRNQIWRRVYIFLFLRYSNFYEMHLGKLKGSSLVLLSSRIMSDMNSMTQPLA
ncbi:hypothetical protein PHYBLDRAFT_174563 [Phycomyces blakesleeanus NRRL 1555(-)]|uniref:FAR1 domain-containing protein n=1 Tax=Phycomyces blakesleeanus (strain ATCC 8743b / DSM 1359 / FGSC 10004 / NBRC 33097 / NRRL 1555) TaxID=763407 RepID=A0A167K328_PHYB8|nr:hypothetical protein PHYBLDRAFT_174563 [Phycomyces blakesleeanus NRRL 1555(-)]OAD67177.1 hypothetical protein PHYBLDRAFT_174563 [Phycomyces blakesleeanus NRRL 1555(-)]|eukprot:XP_018285217.1 hypothetical protein PHYBLDRAFT_174563 [Phycomyces blakesleeanus NRRL 1555(-)]